MYDQKNSKITRRLTSEKFISLLLILGFLTLLLINLNTKLSSIVMPGYLPYDIKRVCEVVFLLLVAAVLCVSGKQQAYWLSQFRCLPQAARYLLFGILLIGIASSWLAPISRMAFAEVALYSLLFVWVLFVAAQPQVWKKSMDKIWISCIALGISLYILTYFVSYGELLFSHKLLAHFPGFVNIRFFSQFQIWTLPIITLLITNNKNQSVALKLIFYTIAMAWWCLAIISITKGLFLALLISTLLAIVLFQRHSFAWLRAQFFSLLGGLLAFSLCFLILPKLLGRVARQIPDHLVAASEVSINTRLYLWHRAWLMIKNKLAIGVGPLHFSYYPNLIAAHPHNSFLLIAAEWGIPVALFLLMLSIWGIWHWCAFVRKSPSATHIALTVSVSAGLLYSLLSGVIVTPLSQLMMGLIIGWMLGNYFANNRNLPLKTTMTQRLMLIFFLVLIINIICWIIIPEIRHVPNMEGYWLMAHQFQAPLLPRFWTQGWLR